MRRLLLVLVIVLIGMYVFWLSHRPIAAEPDIYIPQASSTFDIDNYIQQNPGKKIYKARTGAFACHSTGNIEGIAKCNRWGDWLECEAGDFIDGDRCFLVREDTRVVVLDVDSQNPDFLWVKIEGYDYSIWTIKQAVKQ